MFVNECIRIDNNVFTEINMLTLTASGKFHICIRKSNIFSCNQEINEKIFI